MRAIEVAEKRDKLIIQKKKSILYKKKELLKRRYPKLYVAKYHHKNVHGKPMRFDEKYSWVIEIYKALEEHPDIAWRKSVQCGISETMVVSVLTDSAIGRRCIYVMPNMDLRGKFVKDRLDTLLKTVPKYKQWLKESIGTSESIGMKHFGKGVINFIGSNSAGEMISFPGDIAYVDEVDQCNQRNLEMLPDRLDASELQWFRRAGNPSVEGWGIDLYYKESSQGSWMLKCPHCGKWQKLNWFKNVVIQVDEFEYRLRGGTKLKPLFLCDNSKCQKPMNRLGKGEWVHKYLNRDRLGYHISQLFSANVSLKKNVRTFFRAIGNPIKYQLFHNSKLGLGFSSEDAKHTFESMQAVNQPNFFMTINTVWPKYRTLRKLYMGIDVGKYFHVIARGIIGNKRKLIYCGRVLHVKDLVKLIKTIKPNSIMIDKNPEIHKVEELKEDIKNLYSCEYSKGRVIKDNNKASREYKIEREVKIDRTLILDTVLSDFKNKVIINPINAKDIGNEDQDKWGEYYSNMMAAVRIFDDPSKRFVWRETEPDHFMHAEGYCKLAELMSGDVLGYYEDIIEDIGDMSLEELQAHEKKKKSLIPKILNVQGTTLEDLEEDEEIRLMNAQSFLAGLSNHTEEFLAENKNKGKNRSDY